MMKKVCFRMLFQIITSNFLMLVIIARLKAQQCRTRQFKIVSQESPSLLPEDIISSHNVEHPVQPNCNFRCFDVSGCVAVGFNFRANTNAINCQGSLSGIYKISANSFIFSLVNKDNLRPFKSLLNPRQASAIYNKATYGPTFGSGHDIYIADNANANAYSYTNFGQSFHAPTGYTYRSTETRNLFAGFFKFTPNEVETFYYN